MAIIRTLHHFMAFGVATITTNCCFDIIIIITLVVVDLSDVAN